MLEVKTLCDRERVQNNKTTKKLKQPAGRGIHFLENSKKKKKKGKTNFLLVLVFVFESEGLRLLPLINNSALNNDHEVPYSIYKK